MTGAEMKIPTPDELEAMLARGELKLLGAGSRRECYAIPGTNLCLKCYRDESTAPNATVAREIRKYRHNEKRNTCAQEYCYWLELKAKLPAYVFAAFPESFELVHLPTRGYALLESRVENEDGSACKRFSRTYRTSDESTRAKLLKEFWLLVGAFAAYGVRFYDTQNIVVQRRADNSYRLRVVDFEPAARTLIPIDALCPAIMRGKVIRRAKRYLKQHCGVRARYKGLPSRLRRKWDSLILGEGIAMGLTDCVPFLENKLANDIFYRGTFNGRTCVVKCSSRDPESLNNEYIICRDLYRLSPRMVPEPFSFWMDKTSSMAILVMEAVPGRDLFVVTQAETDGKKLDYIAKQLLDFAVLLGKAGVVYRDISPFNFLIQDDLTVKVIDFQYACRRKDYRETPWMMKHPKYLHTTFAFNGRLGGCGWNDAEFLATLVARMGRSPVRDEVLAKLESIGNETDFLIRPQTRTILVMWLTAFYQRLQIFFLYFNSVKRAKILDRHLKVKRFLEKCHEF